MCMGMRVGTCASSVSVLQFFMSQNFVRYTESIAYLCNSLTALCTSEFLNIHEIFIIFSKRVTFTLNVQRLANNIRPLKLRNVRITRRANLRP